jgi:hypothetical protein
VTVIDACGWGLVRVAVEQRVQVAEVKEFVEGWYKRMKPTYWHGAHTDGLYFGYWCLEAAPMTVLWDIDDSSYRDNLVYPKDLVDFARQQHAAARAAETPKPHISRTTGEARPPAGRWGVLESPGAFVQERFFKEGDTFRRASVATVATVAKVRWRGS